jgi:ABC-type multidrug transport system fused ATPase/permease subunit
MDDSIEIIETIRPPGIFKRFGRFVKNIFVKKVHDDYLFSARSPFKRFYEDIDKSDPLYDSVRKAATLCEDATRVAQQRVKTSAELHRLEEQLAELTAFINLTEAEVDKLKKLLGHYVALSRERSTSLEKLSDYDSGLVDMYPIEKEAAAAVPVMKEAEKSRRALRHDIGCLSGEREELAFERGDMVRSMAFIRKFTVWTLVSMAFVSIVLLYMHLFARTAVVAPIMLLAGLVMAVVSILYMFRRKVRREMRLNMRKQHKAVMMLNQKNVVFAYYTNYLRYCYKKYRVKNARTLEDNLKDMESYRYLANRIDVVRHLLMETEETIERFVRDKRLSGMRSTMESFAKTVNIDDKRSLHNEIQKKKDVAERTLNELDKRHEEIWGILMQLNEEDYTEEQMVGKIVNTYLKNAEKLFVTINEDDEWQDERPEWQIFDWADDPSSHQAESEGL